MIQWRSMNISGIDSFAIFWLESEAMLLWCCNVSNHLIPGLLSGTHMKHQSKLNVILKIIIWTIRFKMMPKPTSYARKIGRKCDLISRQISKIFVQHFSFFLIKFISSRGIQVKPVCSDIYLVYLYFHEKRKWQQASDFFRNSKEY